MKQNVVTSFFLCMCSLVRVTSINNGKGITPPMGWRSWNLFGDQVNQNLMQKQMDGMVSRDRNVDGVPTSLYDLGYSDVGLDDAWQLCGKYGNNNYTYHNASIYAPMVNTELFPDFNAMTDYAHKLNLTAGWYGNNCICRDHCEKDECYRADVNALIRYGFDSIKLDGCGKQLDLDKWAALFNESGKKILIENCHWGNTVPTQTWCPWNIYRTSGDVRASYESVINNLMSTVKYAKAGLSRPGCWSYPDMLEVGVRHGAAGNADPGLTLDETRTHFGAWCIISSPLILSHDTTNSTITDSIWDIISNKEAIAVNQAWTGESGTIFAEHKKRISLYAPITRKIPYKQSTWGISDHIISLLRGYPATVKEISVGEWQQWSKRINPYQTAVIMINHSSKSKHIRLIFEEVPSYTTNMTLSVRDIWKHRELGVFHEHLVVKLNTHESAFLLLSEPEHPYSINTI